MVKSLKQYKWQDGDSIFVAPILCQLKLVKYTTSRRGDRGAVVRWKPHELSLFSECLTKLQSGTIVVFDDKVIGELKHRKWVCLPVVVSVWQRRKDSKVVVNLHALGNGSVERESAAKFIEDVASIAQSMVVKCEAPSVNGSDEK